MELTTNIKASDLQTCIENGTRLKLLFIPNKPPIQKIVVQNLHLTRKLSCITPCSAYKSGTLSKTVVHRVTCTEEIDITDIFERFDESGCQLVGDITVKSDGVLTYVIYQFSKSFYVTSGASRDVFWGIFLLFFLEILKSAFEIINNKNT